MFGDFDGAHLFGVLLATVQDEHVQRLHTDYFAMADMADKAYAAAHVCTPTPLRETSYPTDPNRENPD